MIPPNSMGFIGKTGGSKITVSVPKMKLMMPRKKKDRPTVTMMTVSTGSPISFSRKSRSVIRPRMKPMMIVKSKASRKGTPQRYNVRETYAPIRVNSPMARLSTPEHL